MSKNIQTYLSLAVVSLLLFTVSIGRAEKASLIQARTYFTAGARAYDAGEYLAAIQAFETALGEAKRAGIVFSIAQSYRQQYYIDQEFTHLRAAVENYRRYLTMTTRGGRRAEASRHLSELNPLYNKALEEGMAESRELASKTRVMVASVTKGAKVSLDGNSPEELPLIAEVEPGFHRVVVSADGYETAKREIEAAEGAVVALDLELVEKPARISIQTKSGARILLNGRYLGKAPLAELAVVPGKYLVSVKKNGREAVERTIVVARDQARTVDVKLETTVQRRLSYVAFGFGVAGVATGGVFTGFALKEQSAASDLLEKRDGSFLTTSELGHYEKARENRNRWQTVAVVGYGTGVALGVMGVLMYAFDQPKENSGVSIVDEDLDEGSDKPSDESLDKMELSAMPWASAQEFGLSVGGRF